jgi:phosphoglycolate phosphatase
MARDLRGIVFDKDGTLFDFRRSWGRWTETVLHSLSDGGDPAAMARAIGFLPHTGDFMADSPVIAGTPRDIAEALAPSLPGWRIDALEAHLNQLSGAAEMQPVTPLVPFLTGLRDRGLRLGLATNDTEAPARMHLARHGLTDLFDLIAGCDSGWGAKPGPGMLTAFAAHAGLSPDRVAMVGDSRHDLAAGRAAGMVTVGVLTGIAGADDLSDLADTVMADITHLPEWLDAP